MANIESHLREVADAIEVRFAQILLVARPYLFWVWLRHLRHRVFSLHIHIDLTGQCSCPCKWSGAQAGTTQP